MPITEREHLEILRQMLRIRSFEQNLYQMYLNKQVPGMSPHLSVGQEAVAAGVCHAMRPEDYLLTTHRGHGHVLAKGADMNRMLAEILGKESGYCHGRGGSMHIADVHLNIVGANGIVGGGMPIALGVALPASTGKPTRWWSASSATPPPTSALPRVAEHVGRHEAAGGVGLREQPVRAEHLHLPDAGRRVDRRGAWPMACRAARSTAITWWTWSRRPARRSTGPAKAAAPR